ncbi:Ig-like domain-containing domain, partial [Singulisphaera rosea]
KEETQTETAAEPSDATGAPDVFQDYPPLVIKTVPAIADTEVDPKLSEIRITFSREMEDGSWSVVQNSAEAFPKLSGKPRYAKGTRTCLLPVELEPGKTYALWCNTSKFRNFKDLDGRSAVPYLLVFRTKKP